MNEIKMEEEKSLKGTEKNHRPQGGIQTDRDCAATYVFVEYLSTFLVATCR